MKRMLGWVVVVSLVSGGGLILFRAYKRLQAGTPLTAVFTLPNNYTAIPEKVGPENTASGKVAIESEEAGTQRVTKIGELVNSSILSDSQSIEKLNANINDLQKTITNLMNSRHNRETRVAQLQRIKEVLESNRLVAEDHKEQSRAAMVVRSEELARWGKEDEAVKVANTHFKKNVAQIQRDSNSTSLTLDGHSLLILDDKPVRVSRENASALGSLITSFKEDKNVENVVIRSSRKISLANVRALNEYLNRVYGVTPIIVQVPESEGSRFPIEIEFQGKTTKTSETATEKSDKKVK